MTNVVILAWKELYRWLGSEDLGEKLLGWAIVLIILLPILGVLFFYVLLGGIDLLFAYQNAAREASLRQALEL